MSHTQLPFAFDGSDNNRDQGTESRLLSRLPKKLRKASKENPFLADYLRYVPMDEIGVPDYYSKLSRNLKELEKYLNR